MDDLSALLEVSRVLSDKDTDAEKVEEALAVSIDGYGVGELRYGVVRLWFGLAPTTREMSSPDRHRVAWERLGDGELSTFRTHRAEEYYEFLAKRLADLHTTALAASPKMAGSSDVVVPYGPSPAVPIGHGQGKDEPPAIADSPNAEQKAARRPLRRIQRWTAMWLMLGVVVAGSVRLLTYGHSSRSHPRTVRTATTTANYSLTTPANFPLLLKGSGTDTLHARGYYGGRQFVARGGVVIVQSYGIVEIKLFPEPVSCALWYRGTPAGIDFEIGVDATATNASAIPVGRPLREYELGWTTDRGNFSHYDGVSAYYDGIRNPGTVTLTSIDTSAGGFWRGIVSTGRSESSTGKRQNFAGTFAAEWCNMRQGPITP